MLNARAPAQSKGKSKGRGKLGSKGKGKGKGKHRTGANRTPLGHPGTTAAEGDGDDSSSFTLGGFVEPVGIPDGGDIDWLPDGGESSVSEGRYSDDGLSSPRSDEVARELQHDLIALGQVSSYDLEGMQKQHQYELEALRQKQALYLRQHHPQCLGQHCLICPRGLHRHEQLDLLRRQKLEMLDLQQDDQLAPEQQDDQLAPKEEPAATVDPYL
jgi:hypothetical protein